MIMVGPVFWPPTSIPTTTIAMVTAIRQVPLREHDINAECTIIHSSMNHESARLFMDPLLTRTRRCAHSKCSSVNSIAALAIVHPPNVCHKTNWQQATQEATIEAQSSGQVDMPNQARQGPITSTRAHNRSSPVTCLQIRILSKW